MNSRKPAVRMTDSQNLNIQMRLVQQQSMRWRKSPPIPRRFSEIGPQNNRCRGFCRVLSSDQQQNRRSVFKYALEAEPDSKGNALDSFLWKVADIEDYSAKASSLKQQVCTTQHLIQVSASHPEQMPHVDACSGSGFRIERIRPIHKCADLASLNQS